MRLLCVGFGNMGQALLLGMLEKGWKKEDVAIADPSEHAQKVAAQYAIKSHQQGATYDMVLLAIKPQMVEAVMPSLKGVFAPDSLCISIMAGVSSSTLESHLPENVHIIRVMPNTPAAIGHGVSVLYAGQHVTSAQKSAAEDILQAVGTTCWIDDENDMHAVTALSGSGPAYVFLLIEAMSAAGQKLGLGKDIADMLARQTVSGAGALAAHEAPQKDAAALRQAVTSPGGTTEAALNSFYAQNFAQIVETAMAEAKARSQVLAGGSD